jgi:hypothetical protein
MYSHRTQSVLKNLTGLLRLGLLNLVVTPSIVVGQVRKSTAAALKDGKLLIEIEFPTAGLDSTAGKSLKVTALFLDCHWLKVGKKEASGLPHVFSLS